MKRLFNLTGTIVWIGLLCYGTFYLFQNFQTVAINILAVIGGLALIAILIRLFYGENWMLNLGKQFFIGSDLIQATENFLGDLPKPSKESTANLVGHLVYRFTRLGVIGLALAAIPIWLLFNQNQLINVQTGVMDNQTTLLESQTKLLEKQTKRLDQQTYLQEAERRSSLVFLFSNIMDAIDRELREDLNEEGKRDLSPQLIARITGLSERLKPYYYLDEDTLITKPLSPERGQLIIALLGSELDSVSLREIVENFNLSGADLNGADLSDAYLRKANLSEAYLNEANLNRADLNNANLKGIDLRGVNMRGSNLEEANLEGANLEGADLSDSNLRGVKLSGARLIIAGLGGTNLKGANLREANLQGAYLKNVDLRSTIIEKADMRGADLRGVNMRGTDLRDIKFNNADLRGVSCDSINIIRLFSDTLISKKYTYNKNKFYYEIKEK